MADVPVVDPCESVQDGRYLAARANLPRADIIAIGGLEVAMAEQWRGEPCPFRCSLDQAGGGTGAEAVWVDRVAEEAPRGPDDLAIDRVVAELAAFERQPKSLAGGCRAE